MSEIKEVLNYFWMLPKYKGYHYLYDAIELCQEHPEYLTQITKTIYPQLALKHHVTAWSVERNIRTAIDISWKQDRHRFEEGEKSRYNQFFDYNVIIRPSNASFISAVVVYLEKQGTIHSR